MNELQHHGVKGMKWGVRRYQNKDGTLTPAGRKKYADADVRDAKARLKNARREYNEAFNKADAHRLRAFHPKKSERDANADRWKDVLNKSEALNRAKSEYKAERKRFKETYKADLKAARKHDGMKELFKMTVDGPEKAYFIGKKEVGKKYYKKIRGRIVAEIATGATVGSLATTGAAFLAAYLADRTT